MRLTDVLADLSFITLDGPAAPLHADVTLAFTELRGRVTLLAPDRLQLVGAVPAADGKLTLRAQRGLAGAVDAVGEIHVDDAEVDQAFVVRGDDPALLVHMLPELRALAGIAPTIAIDGARVDVLFDELAAPDAKRALEGALAVWHRVAFFRLG